MSLQQELNGPGKAFLQSILCEVGKNLIGMEIPVQKILVALLAEGHVLIEGAPGLAKTSLANSLAGCLRLKFQRIQFTPDLMPSDLVGSLIFSPKTGEFEVRKGPVFSQLILADEINRAPAKVQSALLEAMQEKQVTLGETTYLLPPPFMVLATQNPLEQEGTYPLPEAQLDRFMMKILIDYPGKEQEIEILKKHSMDHYVGTIKLIDPEKIFQFRESVKKIHVEACLMEYMVNLARKTRELAREGYHSGFGHGVSPRATFHLMQAARAHAFLEGRDFVVPQDIKFMLADVFRHRIGLNLEAFSKNQTPDDFLEKVLAEVVLS